MGDLVFELGLAIALMTVATVLAGRLKLSVVPMLILIGLAVGPHAPHIGPIDFRFIQSEPLIQFMGRLGVLFLLFYLGLEFSLHRFMRTGRSIAVSAAIFIGFNLTCGLVFAWLAGFPLRETLVVAGIVTVSSSAIAARTVIDLKRTASHETGLLLGVMMADDVFVSTYIAVISGFAFYKATSFGGIAVSTVAAIAFVVIMFLLGRYMVRYLNRLLGTLSEESVMLFGFAALFLIAGVADTVGLAEAIGGLLIGLVLAETGHAVRMQRLTSPFRDFFGAFLFFSFGLSIDPQALGGAAGLGIVAATVTILANVIAGLIAGRVAGMPTSAGLRFGLGIVSRGEISIVIASVATAAGLLAIIQPFTAIYVLILSVAGPILARESDSIYRAGRRLARMRFRRASSPESPGT